MGLKYTGAIDDIAPILSSIFNIDIISSASEDKYELLCSNPIFPLAYAFMLAHLMRPLVYSEDSIPLSIWNYLSSYTANVDRFSIKLSLLSSMLGIKLSLSKILIALERYGIRSEVSLNSSELLVSLPRFKGIANASDAFQEVIRILFPIFFKSSYKSTKSYTQQCHHNLVLFLQSLGFHSVKTQPFTNHGEVQLANPISMGKEYVRTNMYSSLVSACYKTNLDNLMEIGTVFRRHSRYYYSYKAVTLMQKCSSNSSFTTVDNVLTSLVTLFAHRKRSVFKEIKMQIDNHTYDKLTVISRYLQLGFLEVFSISTIYDGTSTFRSLSVNLSFLNELDCFLFEDILSWIPDKMPYCDKNFFCKDEDEYFNLLFSLLKEDGIKYLRDGYLLDGQYKCTFRFLKSKCQ